VDQADVEHSFDLRIECGEPIAIVLFKFWRQGGSVEIFKKQGGRASFGFGYMNTENQ